MNIILPKDTLAQMKNFYLEVSFWSKHESACWSRSALELSRFQHRVMCVFIRIRIKYVRYILSSVEHAPVEHTRLIKWLEELAKSRSVTAKLEPWLHIGINAIACSELVWFHRWGVSQIFSHVGAFDFPCYVRFLPPLCLKEFIRNLYLKKLCAIIY